MDFLFTPEQDEAAALAAEILADKATVERMKAVEAAGEEGLVAVTGSLYVVGAARALLRRG